MFAAFIVILGLCLVVPHPAAAQDPDPLAAEILGLATSLAGHAATGRRTFIEGKLEEAGIDYERLPFHHAKLKGTNVELRFGPEKGPALVFCAHHDVRLGSAGANDDASGCALLLALARRLQLRDDLVVPIRLVFLDGSQKGLLGAKAWCESRARVVVDRVLVFDLCGRGDRLVVGSSRRPYANRAPGLIASAVVLAGDLPTDHKAFAAAGLDAAFVSLCPESDLEILKRRYQDRDLRSALPAHMIESLRGRDAPAALEGAALALAYRAALGALDVAAAERAVGQHPRPSLAADLKELSRCLGAGEFEAAGKLAGDLGANGFLQTLSRAAPPEEEAVRAKTALRLVAGDELRKLIKALLDDPASAEAEVVGLKRRIFFSRGHFRLADETGKRTE